MMAAYILAFLLYDGNELCLMLIDRYILCVRRYYDTFFSRHSWPRKMQAVR